MVEAKKNWEEVEGMLECYTCDYKGKMSGYIDPDHRSKIQFVCPECEALEVITNPFG